MLEIIELFVDCKRLSEKRHSHDEAVHRVQQPPAAVNLGSNPAAHAQTPQHVMLPPDKKL